MSTLSELISEASSLTNQIELKRIKDDPYFFLTRFCYTLDEHNPNSPYNLIPKKEYIKDLCDLFVSEDMLAIEKSRQMMVSWVFCALVLWFTMFNRPEGTRVFWLSKKEKDADAAIDRIKIIYQRLPDWLRRINPADEPLTYLNLSWRAKNTVIQGLASGPDQVRQYTASLIVCDEAAFQDRLDKVYEAARPSLLGGGKFVMISTGNGREFFYRTCRDVW